MEKTVSSSGELDDDSTDDVETLATVDIVDFDDINESENEAELSSSSTPVVQFLLADEATTHVSSGPDVTSSHQQTETETLVEDNVLDDGRDVNSDRHETSQSHSPDVAAAIEPRAMDNESMKAEQRRLATSLGLLPTSSSSVRDPDEEDEQMAAPGPMIMDSFDGVGESMENGDHLNRHLGGSQKTPDVNHQSESLDRANTDGDATRRRKRNLINDNEYVPEAVWCRLADWYGVHDEHPLDRKLLGGAASFNDRVEFEICPLSAFSGIVEHSSRKFNRFEEIGYIEFQLRRIFGVDTSGNRRSSDATRLWISEREVVPPRFRMLTNRNRMLNDHLQRGDRKYILALEVRHRRGVSKSGCYGGIADEWPTGEPGESRGDLEKFANLLGRQTSHHESPELSMQWDLNLISQSTDTRVFDLPCGSVVNFSDLESKLESGPVATGKAVLAMLTSKAKAVAETLQLKMDETEKRENELTERKRRLDDSERKLEAAMAELDRRKSKLDVQQNKVDRTRDFVERLRRTQSSKIKLDVGGTVFLTSRRTLVDRDSQSLLAAMFPDGEDGLRPETDGSYFIDRDGSHFRYVIGYLRNGVACSLPSDVSTARHVLCEAKFFQLKQLVKRLEDWLIEQNVSVV